MLLAALSLPAGAATSPPPPEASFSLAIAGGKVPAESRAMRVVQGATVVIRLASDAPGEAHLHGYRLAAKLGPGRDATWRFAARATGRFRIEWHAEGQADAHAHGAPLATLDVLPP